MKILIDENMPYAASLFSQFGHVIAKVGRSLTPEDLIDIDALMIRSVTTVNDDLLAKANKLRFIGTATAGVDHIDVNALKRRDIAFCAAPGCNKIGVAEYVLSALLVLGQRFDFSIKTRKVGIVGAGQVGSYLAKCLEALDIDYRLCDPLKAKEGDKRTFVSLNELIDQCDVISLHTPLTTSGPFPTYHLIGEKELKAMAEGSIIINAARGSVIDNIALKKVLKQKSLLAVLDVFEKEPLVDLELLSLLTFATPHIAGYGLEGKARGTCMIFNAYLDFLAKEKASIKSTYPFCLGDIKAIDSIASLLPKAPFPSLTLSQKWNEDHLMSLTQLIYDIRKDDGAFRRMMAIKAMQKENFDKLRKNYWDRREYSAITVTACAQFGVHSLAQLGFTVEEI